MEQMKITRAYNFEIRAENNEKNGDYITGRPIVYNSKTDLGWFDEIIEAGALDKANLKDVRFLVNHNTDMIPLARSRNNNENSTMQLEVDKDGMAIRVNLDTENNTEARNLYSAIKRGDITGMSFMFTIDDEEWADLDSEHPTRHIRKIAQVFEVSAVTFPAYESTEISAREASDTTISTNLTNEINRATTRENKIEQDCIASVQGLQSNVNDVNTSLTNKINIVDGKLVNYLPLTGGTLSGALLLENNCKLIGLDTSGGEAYLAYVSPSNNVILGSVFHNTYLSGTTVNIRYGGTSGIYLDSSGKVGIGTTAPEYKLHVVGTTHISGSTSFDSSITLKGTTSTTARIIMSRSSYNYINYPTDGSLCLGTSNSSASTQLFIDGATGNVGIGTVEPSVKLSVKGNSQLKGTVYVTNLEATTIGEDSGKIKFNSIHPTNTDKDKLRSPYIQAIYQGNYSRKRLSIFQSNATNYTDDFVEVFTVLPNGNVGIGTTKPQCKLDVNGNVSGDFVDWYGVSWSENSSDPTCTRIGNMAMHKSLPIQSAMKGYYISNINDHTPEIIIPMDENWTNVKYDISTNDSTNIGQLPAGNDMVKIPEFWYIDDYEPSTKTHNLKISQTAKAGWCHHKEAYVGAYEGFAQGNQYLSIKGQIPTVDLTRKLIRPLARSNGYQGEYKWNIYTYEEHRAICHLFLVEYATRNSQLAVNTALTADGFKQGGLGSGCTTGAMNKEYSFIPTGTTNSLGNGSGQVAYTASNGTTYYANRYRGIENPFGHIWKHVDDIVNVYNADTTYKTVYKCNKPEHFANNKTDKYKPLCSFPGGAKMQGWSKEIKATINCDFFKYSVGGSESTYWCDYNYDDNDTTEHCLLIGGRSDYGSMAGLFRFTLHNGVDHSYADIGSRLTYLPWAE